MSRGWSECNKITSPGSITDRAGDQRPLAPVTDAEFPALLPRMWISGVWYGRVAGGVGRTGVI